MGMEKYSNSDRTLIEQNYSVPVYFNKCIVRFFVGLGRSQIQSIQISACFLNTRKGNISRAFYLEDHNYN
jgi:hypothetical protein